MNKESVAWLCGLISSEADGQTSTVKQKEKMNILTRIKKAQDEFFERTGDIPKLLVVGKREEHELLFWLREQKPQAHGRIVSTDESTESPSLDGCQIIGMHVFLEKDVLLLGVKR